MISVIKTAFPILAFFRTLASRSFEVDSSSSAHRYKASFARITGITSQAKTQHHG